MENNYKYTYYKDETNSDELKDMINRATRCLGINRDTLIKLYIDSKEIKHVYIQEIFFMIYKREIIETALKLARIIKKHILLGINHPCFIIGSLKDYTKYGVINIGYINRYNNYPDKLTISDITNAIYLHDPYDKFCEMNKIILPDNIELCIGYGVKPTLYNLGHCSLIDYDKEFNFNSKIRVEDEIVFDRLNQNPLNLCSFKGLRKLEFKESCNVSRVIKIDPKSIDEITLNSKIKAIGIVGSINFIRENKNLIIKTPLDKLSINNHTIQYDNYDRQYYDTNGNKICQIIRI